MSNNRAYHLRSGKWKTVALNFGLLPRRITIEINATRPVKWRRLALIPGLGSFNAQKKTFLFWGILQLKCYENRTATVYTTGERKTYENYDVDNAVVPNNPDASSRRTKKRSSYNNQDHYSSLFVVVSFLEWLI
ncbi:MAG TPA: hypothetical protein DIW24_07910 [Bacteroidetes bacterium]|nr:hypothetical protein [Bacteroidota bacterium]HRR10281.1 hypothetical protein [Rhodothermales bacterium]